MHTPYFQEGLELSSDEHFAHSPIFAGMDYSMMWFRNLLVFYRLPWYSPFIWLLIKICLEISFLNEKCWSHSISGNWLTRKLYCPWFWNRHSAKNFNCIHPHQEVESKLVLHHYQDFHHNSSSISQSEADRPDSVCLCSTAGANYINTLFLPHLAHLTYYGVRSLRIDSCDTPSPTLIDFHC